MSALTEIIRKVYDSKDPFLIGKYREGFYDAIDDMRLYKLDIESFRQKRTDKNKLDLHYAYIAGYNAKALSNGLPSLPFQKEM